MGCTFRELGKRMDGAELHQWWVGYQMEPWGEERADLRMAILASTIVQLERPKARVPLDDFLPDFYAQYRPKVSAQAVLKSQAAFRLVTQMVGGTVRRSDDAKP